MAENRRGLVQIYTGEGKGKTTAAAPLTEKSDQYKITKESASQLGLNFETEE